MACWLSFFFVLLYLLRFDMPIFSKDAVDRAIFDNRAQTAALTLSNVLKLPVSLDGLAQYGFLHVFLRALSCGLDASPSLFWRPLWLEPVVATTKEFVLPLLPRRATGLFRISS